MHGATLKADIPKCACFEEFLKMDGEIQRLRSNSWSAPLLSILLCSIVKLADKN